MTIKHYQAPKFQWSFIYNPKYWPLWILLGVLYAITWLPYAMQMWLGKQLGRLLYKLVKSRRKIAARNIELCFPDMSKQEQDAIVKQTIENTGIAMMETSMAWWWPNWRVNRISSFKGLEHLEKAKAEGKGVLLLAAHKLHLEMDGRIFGNSVPSVGFYRPHDNPLYEYFQYHGRCRTNKYMVGKRNVKGLIASLNATEVCFYLPDQDYGRNRCEFVPFFAVEDTATTTGTLLFAADANCVVIPLISHRLPNNQGYELELQPPFENFPSNDPAADVTRVNQWVEQAVLKDISQYMWVHRRFKTQQDPDAPSRYK